jgi:hypothetical protein
LPSHFNYCRSLKLYLIFIIKGELMKITTTAILFIALLFLASAPGCQGQVTTPSPQPTGAIAPSPVESAVPSPTASGEKPTTPAKRHAKPANSAFLKHYKPPVEKFTVAMPGYKLPLSLSAVSNLNKIQAKYLGSPGAKALLAQNGFVVVNGGPVDDICSPYTALLSEEIPIYVTADTPLHLFNIQFDETLKDIEERVFYKDIQDVSKALLEASQKDYNRLGGTMKEASKRNVAYFSVALRQFDPDFKAPGYVKKWVDWECSHIDKQEGLTDYADARQSSLFKIPEDYSQYKPRGHYTRSEVLKKYFRGMMWYGRITFLLKGHEKYGPISPPAMALTDRETARLQTLQAALISEYCDTLPVTGGKKIADLLGRIYTVTAFYVGFADDLSVKEYREAMRKALGEKQTARALENQGSFARFVFEISKMRKPAIFSGTGDAGIDPGGREGHALTSIKELDDILANTMGMRLMGQKYIPDSYIMGQMVSPGAGTIGAKIPERFTVGYVSDDRIQPDLMYSIRAFPRGLDVFSVLGSTRAENLLKKSTDDGYPQYYEQLRKLRAEFDSLSPEEWNQNLYWSWLYALKTLAETRGEGYQAYQRNDPWLDRQLDTALASWAALRHNTILYAKQSYTPHFIGTTSADPRPPMPPPPPPPKGLVEPLPEFYARILATATMARDGLKELGVLDGASEGRLSSLVSTLETLNDICRRQVANKPITKEDNAFLAGFPQALKGAIGDVDEKGLKTTFIADVHTDVNSKQCLEEASGHVDYIIVAYKRAEGDIVLAVGPVLSYYEFKHPMNDRLTDEKWREMLGSKPPDRPEWIESYRSRER